MVGEIQKLNTISMKTDTLSTTPPGLGMITNEIEDIIIQKQKLADTEKLLDASYKQAAKQVISIIEKKGILPLFRNFIELKTITDKSHNKEVKVFTGFNMLESVIKDFIWRSMQEDNRVLSALFFSEIPKSHVWLHLNNEEVTKTIELISEQTDTHGFRFCFIRRYENFICISASYDFKTKHAWID